MHISQVDNAFYPRCIPFALKWQTDLMGLNQAKLQGRAPWRCSKLRIQHGPCWGLSGGHGTGSIHGPGTSACSWHGQKKKKGKAAGTISKPGQGEDVEDKSEYYYLAWSGDFKIRSGPPTSLIQDSVPTSVALWSTQSPRHVHLPLFPWAFAGVCPSASNVLSPALRWTGSFTASWSWWNITSCGHHSVPPADALFSHCPLSPVYFPHSTYLKLYSLFLACLMICLSNPHVASLVRRNLSTVPRTASGTENVLNNYL